MRVCVRGVSDDDGKARLELDPRLRESEVEKGEDATVAEEADGEVEMRSKATYWNRFL